MHSTWRRRRIPPTNDQVAAVARTICRVATPGWYCGRRKRTKKRSAAGELGPNLPEIEQQRFFIPSSRQQQQLREAGWWGRRMGWDEEGSEIIKVYNTKHELNWDWKETPAIIVLDPANALHHHHHHEDVFIDRQSGLDKEGLTSTCPPPPPLLPKDNRGRGRSEMNDLLVFPLIIVDQIRRTLDPSYHPGLY